LVGTIATVPSTARLAGQLLGRTGGRNTADALLAAESVAAQSVVLTSDPDHLRTLLADHPAIDVVRV
jgi:hypothetical protein